MKFYAYLTTRPAVILPEPLGEPEYQDATIVYVKLNQLRNASNDNGMINLPDKKKFADLCKMNEHRVQRAREQLEELGLIKQQRFAHKLSIVMTPIVYKQTVQGDRVEVNDPNAYRQV